MLSRTRMGVPYEYTHMGRPIRVWANIRIWGRTDAPSVGWRTSDCSIREYQSDFD